MNFTKNSIPLDTIPLHDHRGYWPECLSQAVILKIRRPATFVKSDCDQY